jgi:hypothetical protein
MEKSVLNCNKKADKTMHSILIVWKVVFVLKLLKCCDYFDIFEGHCHSFTLMLNLDGALFGNTIDLHVVLSMTCSALITFQICLWSLTNNFSAYLQAFLLFNICAKPFVQKRYSCFVSTLSIDFDCHVIPWISIFSPLYSYLILFYEEIFPFNSP